MGKELFETLPDVLDAKLLASALSISKAGAYQLLNRPDFPTLQVGGRKLVTKQKLALWMEQHTNKAKQAGAGILLFCKINRLPLPEGLLHHFKEEILF